VIHERRDTVEQAEGDSLMVKKEVVPAMRALETVHRSP